MDPKYSELLHSYIDSGMSPQAAVNKIYFGGEYSGSIDDLRVDANTYFEEQKKKQNEFLADGSDAGGLIQESHGSQLVSPPSGTGSLVQPPEPETEGPLTRPASPAAIGEEYADRLNKDTQQIVRDLINEGGSSVRTQYQSIISRQDKTDAWKNDAVAKLFKGEIAARQKAKQIEYAAEINERLGDDVDRENFADSLYKGHGLTIPLDGDQRYNEADTGFGGFLRDASYKFAAGAIDFLSFPLSAVQAANQSVYGYDFEKGMMETDQMLSDYAESLRESTTYYNDSYLEAASQGNYGELFVRGTADFAESIPYMVGMSTPVGMAVQFGNATGNSYLDSKREDYNRVAQGLDAVYDPNTFHGEAARAAYSVIDGALTAASGKVQANITQRALNTMFKSGAVSPALGVVKYFAAQGVDIPLEAAIEAVQTGSEMGLATILGNENATVEEIGLAMANSGLAGAFASGGPGGAGGAVQIGKSAYQGLTGSSSIISGANAAVNSPAEKASQQIDNGQINLQNLQNQDALVNSFDRDYAADQKSRAEFYQMMSIRHPNEMSKISQIDAQLHRSIANYKFLKTQEDSKALLDSEFSNMTALVAERQKILSSFESEAPLTQEESRILEDAKISKRVESVDLEVRVLQDDLSRMNDVQGTNAAKRSDAMAATEEALTQAKRKQAKVRKLLGELDAARKNNSKDQKDVEQKLRHELGLPIEQPEVKAQEEVKDEPKVKSTAIERGDVREGTAEEYAESMAEAFRVAKERGDKTFLQVDQVSLEKAQQIVDEGGKLFMGKDGMSGAYVTKDGYMGGLFKNPESQAKGMSGLLQEARDAHGGKYFDAFGTELESMYVKNGYKPVSRTKFNPDFAPEGWDADDSPLKDQPDIVMFTKGEGKVGDGVMTPDYDSAEKVALDEIKTKTSEEAVVQPTLDPLEAEGRKEDAKKPVDGPKVRGVEGDFKENISKGDGSVSVIPSKMMPKKVASFINSKLMPTLKVAYGDKGYKIVEHYTQESHEATSETRGGGAALAVMNPDGSFEIHLNLPKIEQMSKEDGKSAESILIEEVHHGLFSKGLLEVFRAKPKAARQLLKDMRSLAEEVGDTNLLARVDAKIELYKSKGASEIELIDEGVAEIVAEIFGYEGFKDNPSLQAKVKAFINKVMRLAFGSKVIQITDVTDVQQIMNAYKQMVTEGAAIRVADNASDAHTTERAALSPSKLPENESFTMSYKRTGMDKFGGPLPAVAEIETFNGKWHFINWWNQQRRPGSKVRYSDFKLHDPVKGVDIESVDADVMHNWKLKPPVNRKQQRAEAYRQKDQLFSSSISSLIDVVAEKEPSGAAKKAYDLLYNELVEVLGEEKRVQVESFDYEGSQFPSQALKNIAMRVASTEQLIEAVRRVENNNNIEGDATVERALLETTLKVQKERKTRADYERLMELKREVACAKGAGTCAVNNRTSLLQFIAKNLETKLGKNPTFDESVDWISDQLKFTSDYMSTMEGIDIKDAKGQFERGRDALFDKIRKDPQVNVDPKNYSGVFPILVSYFSNGSLLDPNLHLASQVFRAGLLRAEDGSAFISNKRIQDIEDGTADSFLPSVRGQRQKAVASHLRNINEIVEKYTTDGVFDEKKFFEDAKKRGDGDPTPALARMIGKETTKMAELTLGLMGDPKALPMDSHMRDLINVATGKFEGPLESMVVPMEKRLGVINKMNALGFDANPMMSDPELFAVIGEMKKSDNPSVVARGQEMYRTMIGNLTQELRNMNAEEIVNARQLVNAVAKKLGVTIFEAQQMMYMNGTYSLTHYKGRPFVSDYESNLKATAEKDLSTVNADGLAGHQMEMNFAEQVESKSAVEFGTEGRKFMGSLSGVTKAVDNQLNRKRTPEQATLVKVRGNDVKITDKAIADALSTDAASKRIMAKGIAVEPGRKVGIRLNLNVMKNTGVPVQTMHEKTASGEALQYAGAVTVKNATLFVNPEARKKIATFQDNKFPMASVNGEFVSSDINTLNYDGVKATFNPFLQGAFVDAAGRPIKSASEATIIGGDVYLRGEIEYFSADDAKLLQGSVESDANRERRTKRGPKYDKALSRFQAYADRVLGQTFDSREALEDAYDNMNLPNETALTDSEVAENAERAMERAAIDGFINKNIRRGADRVAQGLEDLSLRQMIRQDPRNYIAPQKLKELRRDVADLTDAELVDIVNDVTLGKLSSMNDNLSVLAQAEILSRAVARGETDAIPGIVAELASMGTTAGRLLRHLREVKKASPRGMEAFIKSAVEAKGNKLTAEQEAKLKDISGRMFEAHAIVEDLMNKARNGERVGKELKEAENRLKAIEREMDTFTNVVIERGWGEILGPIAQGNLLTTMSQVTNIGANAVNAFLDIAVEAGSQPFKWMGNALASLAGKELDFDRQQSLSAHLYAMSRMGDVAVQTAKEVKTGQKQDLSEWTMSRSLMPFRSLIAAFSGDLPEKSSKAAALNQRAKLFVQGTLGVPAEMMFRTLSLGDTPFRKYFENKALYEIGTKLGLEGEALTDFLKHPPRQYQDKARSHGSQITFQEETVASRTTEKFISGIENAIGSSMSGIKGINGREFAKFMMRLLVPFRSTPANILYETMTYASPVIGSLRIASDINKGNIDDAFHNLGKVVVGTAITETALMLVSKGIISGALEWDEDEEKNLAYDQFPPTSINLSALQRMIDGQPTEKQDDDVFANYMKLGTPGALMAATVKAYAPEDIKDRDYGSPSDFATYAIRDMFGVGPLASAASMLQQSFLQGMNDFIQLLASGDYETNGERLLRGVMNVGMAIPLPNQMSTMYRAQREYLPDYRVTKDMNWTERQMKNIEYTIKDRTFNGAEIPIRYDWKGNPIKQNPRGNNGWMYQLFDITKIRQGEADEVSQEIYRLYESTGEVSKVVSTPSFAKKRKMRVPKITTAKEKRNLRRLSGKDYTFFDDQEFTSKGVYLNTEQLNRLMMIAGKERYNDLSQLVRSSEYQIMPDDKKMEALEELNGKYNGVKEFDGGRFRNHTIAIFDIMQQIYDDERTTED